METNYFRGYYRMRNRHTFKLCVCLWIAVVGWGIVLFYFSGQDGVASGELSMRFTRFVLRLFPSLPYTAKVLHPILRKCAHFCIFAVEGFLLASAMMATLQRRVLGCALTVLICAAVAALNEYHQTFAVGRSCEVRDMLIDAGGAVLGVLFAALFLFFILRVVKGRARGK